MNDKIYLAISFIFLILAWFVGLNNGRKKAALRLLEVQKEITRAVQVRENIVAKKEEKILSKIESIRNDGALLPSLIRWADKLQQEADEIDAWFLLNKKRPAPIAAERLKEANHKIRIQKQLAEKLHNQIDLYESLAPWLREFSELSVDEVLIGLSESVSTDSSSDEDPTRKYLSKIEWESLSQEERLQKALDNYMHPKRRKNLWQIGVDFERYVGYRYEQEGFKVDFHGANGGFEDLGIDLICSKKGEVIIVQCKRLAAIKQIPVRENTVAQIFGAAEFYRLKHCIPAKVQVRPVLVTSYVLSEQAKEFAAHLKVEVQEMLQLSPYPMIKCNISKTKNEKIFHLPFDQQYDKISIGDVKGECYVDTVKDAINKGFRHAYRWKGNSRK
jgi:Holliday junction resolvase